MLVDEHKTIQRDINPIVINQCITLLHASSELRIVQVENGFRSYKIKENCGLKSIDAAIIQDRLTLNIVLMEFTPTANTKLPYTVFQKIMTTSSKTFPVLISEDKNSTKTVITASLDVPCVKPDRKSVV